MSGVLELCNVKVWEVQTIKEKAVFYFLSLERSSLLKTWFYFSFFFFFFLKDFGDGKASGMFTAELVNARSGDYLTSYCFIQNTRQT